MVCALRASHSPARDWFLSVAAILLALCLAGCDRSRPVNTTAAGEHSILALGDSYTIGEGVQESERWPVQLAEQLRGKGLAVAAPVIIARTGWTIGELQDAVDRSRVRGPFGLVTLLIGVNDQFRGGEAEAARAPFRKLLVNAITLAGGEPSRVIVLSIPDWGVTPFAADRDRSAIAAAIDAFNRVQREETTRAGAVYRDITGISREPKADPALVAADQLHPSGRMYARWVEVVIGPAREILGTRP